MSAGPRRKRSGTLHIVAGLLISSALLRFMDGSGQAYAEGEPATPAAVPMTPQGQADSSPDIDTLLATLLAREARVATQEEQITARLQALSVAEAEMQEQLDALVEAEESLRATIALAEEASQTDLGRLTTVYENMKPKDAAALFEEMAPDFAAGFLGMMRPEPAALIMTQLTPQTAHSISVVLAGRNAGVPTQ
ncbi:Flagellar motility protein MotE, a chaperone for MotC folding [Cognatiyoonia koreensis]|uniref:Flagellar motility protein MotE, a chaperone for MotC folding n=1 Tax=Cognatiyoonia koreensis TaxID=364200 RepID=A0A1I0RJX4_9RHOB|nr:hypothetical protein [Cognatiyoonia koreensis]SEW41349.1 Flagellar motility protein MotE, a chaperone for MotC folding [Cognatiyoonia koreensis]